MVPDWRYKGTSAVLLLCSMVFSRRARCVRQERQSQTVFDVGVKWSRWCMARACCCSALRPTFTGWASSTWSRSGRPYPTATKSRLSAPMVPSSTFSIPSTPRSWAAHSPHRLSSIQHVFSPLHTIPLCRSRVPHTRPPTSSALYLVPPLTLCCCLCLRCCCCDCLRHCSFGCGGLWTVKV